MPTTEKLVGKRMAIMAIKRSNLKEKHPYPIESQSINPYAPTQHMDTVNHTHHYGKNVLWVSV